MLRYMSAFAQYISQHFISMLFIGKLCLCIFISAPVFANTTQLFMAGDSLMSVKDPKDYPETGWGMPFSTFFDNSIHTINLAKNGASTKTFISLGLWAEIQSNIKSGDFLVIQFGHNDQSISKTDRYTTPQEYRNNISMMIALARSKKASVILMTPITRRHYDEQGNLKHTHPYVPIVKEIAEQNQDIVTFIDMESITYAYFDALGKDDSAIRFMHIKPDLHPNYPNGVKDNTHLNQLGAREVAQLVLKELKKAKHPLAERLREVDPKHLKLAY